MPPTRTRSTTKRSAQSDATAEPKRTRRTSKAKQTAAESAPEETASTAEPASASTSTRSRPRNAKSVNQASLDAVKSILEEAPAKETQSLNLRQTIAQLQSSIEGALSKGYSHADVAELLAQQGIEISGSTLKRYLSISKPARAKRGGKRGRAKASTSA